MIRGCLRVFSDAELEPIDAAVLSLLRTTGCRVEHQGLRDRLAVRGAIVDDAHQIVRFPAALVREVTEWQRANRRPRSGPQGKPRAGIGGVQFYLFERGRGGRRRADTQDLLDVIHAADALEEISSVGPPLINHAGDPRIELLATLALTLKNTRKPGDTEVLYPEHVEYMARLGGITTGKEVDGRFITGCNFLVSPLVMGHRAAGCLIEKTRFGIPCVAGSQPVSGISAPVTLAGVVVLGCAELLAGWIMGKAVDQDIPLGGNITSGSLDMRTTRACFSSPEAILQDAGVIQVFDELYGGGVGSATDYIDAKEPGLQAAFERAYKRMALGVNIAHGGGEPSVGILDAGAVFSPTQAMLDLDFNRAVWEYTQGIEVSAETIALGLLEEVGAGGSFLEAEHTLRHLREHWRPDLLDRRTWSEASASLGGEEQLLQRAEEKWRAALAAYEPFELDRAAVKAIDDVVRAATEKLSDLA